MPPILPLKREWREAVLEATTSSPVTRHELALVEAREPAPKAHNVHNRP